MSRVRVLVGTKKGAFVLEADGQRKKWDVSGPHFGGWEIYHVKGSPADPERLFASQSTGWFGQIIQRSDDLAEPTGGLRCEEPDRKSTRLNSSYVAISYAVLCSTKKSPLTGCRLPGIVR